MQQNDNARQEKRRMLMLNEPVHKVIPRMAVPTMGLVYDPKVENYLKELDQPSAGHVHHFDAAAAIAAADALMADYDGALERMKEKSALLTAAAGENERLLLELLEKTKK